MKNESVRREAMRRYLQEQMGGVDLSEDELDTIGRIAQDYYDHGMEGPYKRFYAFIDSLHSTYEKGLADGIAAASGVEIWIDPDFKADPGSRAEFLVHAMNAAKEELERRKRVWKKGDPCIEDLEAQTLYKFMWTMMGGANLSDMQAAEMRYLCLTLYRPNQKDPYKYFLSLAEGLQKAYKKGFADGIVEAQLQPASNPNYLKNAEMQLEDDCNMIDGIINNGTKEPESVLERLGDCKAALDQQRAQAPQTQKNIEQEL